MEDTKPVLYPVVLGKFHTSTSLHLFHCCSFKSINQDAWRPQVHILLSLPSTSKDIPINYIWAVSPAMGKFGSNIRFQHPKKWLNTQRLSRLDFKELSYFVA